jgi:hypothetical protein
MYLLYICKRRKCTVITGKNSEQIYCVKIFMYLRAIFCTFQISVDLYFVPVRGRGGGRGGAGEGKGARDRIECILYGYT